MQKLKFKKVLIANRGEIAVRIIRALNELNITAVAVYSEADEVALHIRLADEVYSLGDSLASESYLNIEKIIKIAKLANVDAIHPGYGFLSENAEFATACINNGIVFIGPSPKSIKEMGDKIYARNLAKNAGLPTIGGSFTEIKNIDEAQREAQNIGYPILIKASSGGGGKGMRVVRNDSELPSFFERAKSESKSSFKNDAVYIEKFIENPKHIEVQVIRDSFGYGVHLFERECSIQRRHQKVIEESPSLALDDKKREELCNKAVDFINTANYYSAGTVEFLMDSSKNFYFLEMNTRIQVEHPVTELITGIDLVKEQIKIAEGHKLSFAQGDIIRRGSAIECRIYAEDPENGFMPSPGKITKYHIGEGPGVRVDTGVYEGANVPTYYDPILAKIITWGIDRKEALSRMKRTLKESYIAGVKTNIPLHKTITDDENFQAGKFDTTYLAKKSIDFVATNIDSGNSKIAAAISICFNQKNVSDQTMPSTLKSRWKYNNRLSLRK